jgi:hypothetical protein
VTAQEPPDEHIPFDAPKTPWTPEDQRLIDQAEAEKAESPLKNIVRLPFKGLAHADVLKLAFDDQPDLVDGIVECGVVGVIAGIPETYKSWLAQQIACGVAAGTGEVLGRNVTGKGPVGYFWQDDSRRNEAERVQMYSRVHGTPDDLAVTWFLNDGLVLPNDVARLRATVEYLGLVLVVIDSFYNVATGNLKDLDAGQIIAQLKNEVSDPTGCTLLVVDHMPWATDSNRSRQRPYGDVYKSAAARFGIYIDADRQKLHVEVRGNNIRGLPRTASRWDADMLTLQLVDSPPKEPSAGEVERETLAWLQGQTKRASTRAVRKGVPRAHKAVDLALERLLSSGAVQDCAQSGGAWSGAVGTGRYWKAVNHADSSAPGKNGAQSGELIDETQEEPTAPTAPHTRRVGAVGARRGSACIPLPGDDGFADFIDAECNDVHITEREWLERRKQHAWLATG